MQTLRYFSLILCLMLACFAVACGGDDTDPTDAADASDASDTADASDAADASDVSDASDASDAADASDASDPSDSSDASDASDASDTSDTSDVSDATDAADASDASDATDAADASDASDTTPAEPFTLTSDAMEDGGVFPVQYACSYYYSASGAENISPQFAWSGAPEGTQSFAIVFRDLTFNGFLHSIIYDIPANVSSLAEDLERSATLTEPAGAKQTRGYAGSYGYEGPCPGFSEPHEYQFEIYAMPTATLSGVNLNTDMEQVEAVIKAGDLDSTTLTAVFTPPAP